MQTTPNQHQINDKAWAIGNNISGHKHRSSTARASKK